MKNIINRYLNVGAWFDKFCVYQDGSITDIDGNNNIESLSWKTLCVFEQKNYWQATRVYRGHNPLDLFRIFQAEKNNISPFPAKVFWKIARLSFNYMEVSFYCLPLNDWENIPSKIKFFLPNGCINNANADKLTSPSPAIVNSDINVTKLKLLPVYNLIGFFSRRSIGSNNAGNYNYKKLALSAISVVVLYVAFSSAYLWTVEYFVESSIEKNKDASIELVQHERVVKKLVNDLEKISSFSENSTDVLSLLASIKVDNESTTFFRVQAARNSISIWGETTGSATKVLETLVGNPLLSDVKFSSPVNKGRLGKEAFVIEAVKKNG